MSDEVQEQVGEDKSNTTKQTKATENRKPEETGVAKTSSSTSLTILSKEQLATLDYEEFNTPGRMLALAEVLVKGDLCPLKKPADVMLALMTGETLGIPLITAISQIYPINGRPSLGTHIQKGLALKHGIIYKRTRHYEPFYMFVEADKDGSPKLVDKIVNKVVTKVPVIISEGFLDEQPQGSLKKEIDKVTEYELQRDIQTASGKWVTITQRGSFSLREALQAELSNKDNWKHYPKDMLDARAFDRAMSEIADDIKGGLKAPEILSNGNIQEAIIVE
jgi:hypothetical protein